MDTEKRGFLIFLAEETKAERKNVFDAELHFFRTSSNLPLTSKQMHINTHTHLAQAQGPVPVHLWADPLGGLMDGLTHPDTFLPP